MPRTLMIHGVHPKSWSKARTLPHCSPAGEFHSFVVLQSPCYPCPLSELCNLNQPNHSFQAYAISIEEMNVAATGTAVASRKETMENDLYNQ